MKPSTYILRSVPIKLLWCYVVACDLTPHTPHKSGYNTEASEDTESEPALGEPQTEADYECKAC